MRIVEKQNEMVELFVENEEKISELYTAYFKKFPEHFGFWLDLAKEENLYVAAMRRLCRDVDELHFSEDRFDSGLIDASLKYLDEKIFQAQNEDISIRDALTVALELETNFIEQQFFKVLEEDPLELKVIFRSREAAALVHVDKTIKFLVRMVNASAGLQSLAA